MFIVSLKTPTGTCYLRGTTWTFQNGRERAHEYATSEAAHAALVKAKPFMKAASFKAAQIVPA